MIENNSEYTRVTRMWLNKRFDLADSDGIYIPNQPAYGFSASAFRLEEYARMYALLKVLNRLSFRSLLDVGCADGYGSAIISRLFESSFVGTDVSDRAIKRGWQLFGLMGVAADAHDLPFADKSFDICICTEVLEHVADPEKVISELRRVARQYVVLSTPRAPDQQTRERHFTALDPNEPHAHIHFFTDGDMREVCGPGTVFFGARTRLINRVLHFFAWTDDSTRVQRESYYNFTISSAALGAAQQAATHEMLIQRYQKTPWWKRFVLGPVTLGVLLRIDSFLARRFPVLALDHLAVIHIPDTCSFVPERRASHTLLKMLLGGFKTAPLRIESR